jgi:hypothetical protein
LTGSHYRVDENAEPSKQLQVRYSRTDFSSTSVNTRKLNNFYNLLHKVQGAAALPHILDGSLGHLTDNTAFLDDGMYCEWA